MSQIKSAHTDNGLIWDVDLTLANKILKGHDNLTPVKERSIAVDPKMLFHIREHIRVSVAWSRHDKRVLWVLCCFMWSGSFKIGDIVSKDAMKKGNVGGQTREFLVVRLLDPKEARKREKALVDVEMFQVPNFYDPISALTKFRERARFALDPDLPVFRWE